MTRDILLGVRDLSVQVRGTVLLRGVSFDLRAGESLTLLGESGAGKSLLAQAVMGNLPGALRAGGRVVLDGLESDAADTRARRPLWGRTLALLPQEPAMALDPLARVAPQLAEVHELVAGRTAEDAAQRAQHALDAAGLGAAARLYPWQISGGMAQRATAAIALAGGARVLLADEPTKGLDAVWRDRTIALMQAVRQAGGCVVAITHDLRVAEALGGRVVVLRDGEVIEQGDAAAVLAAPSHDFTRRLVAADPARWPASTARPSSGDGSLVVEAAGLRKRFGDRTLFDGLDLALRSGERVAVQGPSGSGKSTLGNVLLGLLRPDAGTVRRARGLAPHALQKLYQDPAGAFAPQASLAQSLRDVARRHDRPWPWMLSTLARLGVSPALLERVSAAVSGGELQRIALARVLAVRPALLFADEPTSRLDPLTQQAALSVLLGEVDAAGAALMLVTHDDAIARSVATRQLAFV